MEMPHDRRRRWRRLTSFGNNTCKTDTSTNASVTALLPGESLARGEFLCHGRLRFGIRAADGRVLLGFAAVATDAAAATMAANGTVTVTDAVDAAPSAIAWAAEPNKLFIPKSRPFHALALSPGGNLLGYDAAGEEIYDSNYDYPHRHEGKVDDSRLCLAERCAAGVAGMDGVVTTAAESRDSGGGGALCVAIKSPQMPGHSHGMITWGVAVRADDLEPAAAKVDREPPPASPPPTAMAPKGQTEALPASASPSSAPIVHYHILGPVDSGVPPPPTASPIHARTQLPIAPALLPSPTKSPAHNLFSNEPMSIVWGTAWRDANRNGRMDIGETKVQDLDVSLRRCDAPRDDDGGLVVERAHTDAEGTYYLQVPAGHNYTLRFDLAAYSVLSFSVGQDADTDAEGWTPCQEFRNDRPIKWNAGLYDASSPSAAAGDGALTATSEAAASDQVSASPSITPSASIGGFVYLDADESGTMSSKEHAAAVGGYTVQDAIVSVTLADCVASIHISKIVVEFPGVYSFGNLSEGWYRLEYEIVPLSRDINPGPLYEFVDGAAENSTMFETPCGKLGHAEIINSGNVGLRIAPLNIREKGSMGGPIGPEDELADAMPSSRTDGGGVSTRGEGGGETTEGGAGAFVPALVGVVVTLAVVAICALLFVKYRRGDSSNNLNPPNLTKTRSRDIEHDLSGGKLPLADDGYAPPLVSDALHPNRHMVTGSMICNNGGNSVAVLANGMGDAGVSNLDCDNGSRKSHEESEEKKYTGTEFELRAGNNNGVGGGSGVGSPYQGTSTSAMNHSHLHMEANPLEEGSSEGYEVYDDDDDKSSQGNKNADYGHVISNMIAKYSQKQISRSGDELPTLKKDGQGDCQNTQQERPSLNYQERHGCQTSQTCDYQRHSQEDQQENNNQNRAQYQDNHQIVYQDQNQAQFRSVQDGALSQCQHHQGDDFYSTNAYHKVPHNQYEQYNGTSDYSQQPQQQWAADTSPTIGTSRTSRASADPPAASYKDIPTSNNAVCWDTCGIPQQQSGWDASGVPTQPPMAGWNECHVSPQQPILGWDDTTGFDIPPQQIAVGHFYQAKESYNGNGYDGGAHAATENSDQFVDNGAYASAIAYESDHYAVNNHTENYNETMDEVSSSGSDSDISSDEEETTTGKKLDAIGHSLPSNRELSSSSERRSQSNPRDNRQSTWRHPHTPVESNQFTTADHDRGDYSNSGDNTKESGSIASRFDTTPQSAALDHSADPPGAWYRHLHQTPSKPPSSKRVSPDPNAIRLRGRSVPPPPPRGRSRGMSNHAPPRRN